MKPSYIALILCFSLVMLIGCSNNTAAPKKTLLPLITKTNTVIINDTNLKKAMAEYIEYINAPRFSRFDYFSIDLNNDNSDDALVYLKSPYGQWCNKNGCTLLILQRLENGYSIIGKIPHVRPPLFIKEPALHDTGRWSDVIIRISGREERTRDVILSYDGTAYLSDVTKAYEYKNDDTEILRKIFP